MRQKKQYDIDFIVNLEHEKVYIQSAYKLLTPEKKNKKFAALKRLEMLFANWSLWTLYTDEFGISYVGLIDFMLNKDILARL